MKRIIIILALMLLVVGCTTVQPVDKPTAVSDDTVTIASWNLQVFGKTKADNSGVMKFYDDKMSNYDIIFVEEIRDESETAFKKLCKKFQGYNCDVSEREGRSSSKEQIGIIYKEYVTLNSYTTLEDPKDVWERSPVRANISVHNYTFIVYNTHLKPDDVPREMKALTRVIIDKGNVVLMGDLNADCSYYDEADYDGEFESWKWLIGGDEDTTVSQTDCAYDRIIVNNDIFNEVVNYGIDKEGITKEISDHYLVYVELDVGGK